MQSPISIRILHSYLVNSISVSPSSCILIFEQIESVTGYELSYFGAKFATIDLPAERSTYVSTKTWSNVDMWCKQ